MSIEAEKSALARIILNLKQQGWVHNELDDGGDEWADVSELDVLAVVEECAAVDMCHLLFIKDEGLAALRRGTVLIVWGNSPEELIADATMSHGFDEALRRAEAWQ